MDASGFWDIGPHKPLEVEDSWRQFVKETGGHVVQDMLHRPLEFDNADFLWANHRVVAELKEVQTEFLSTRQASDGFIRLLEKLSLEDPEWRPQLLGGSKEFPVWFRRDFIRLARPAVQRVLKKANVQIRETKIHFKISEPRGVLILVNDGFTKLEPYLVRALACDVLKHSFSSIDCLVYMTVNTYVVVPDSNEPKLLWMPAYSDRADDQLVAFVDDLGRRWFDFLEREIGPFTSRTETQDDTPLRKARVLLQPKD